LLVVNSVITCVCVWLLQASKLYSKHWNLRESVLKTVSQTLCETDVSAGRDVTLSLLKAALVAFNRAVKDNVFSVRISALS